MSPDLVESIKKLNDLLEKLHEVLKPKPRQKREPRQPFVAPTIAEIRAYCQEIDVSVDAANFHNYYESKGWMIGKNKMSQWKAAVRTWARNKRGAL